MKRRLSYYGILNVFHVDELGYWEHMKQLPPAKEQPPEGHYRITSNGIDLPKKKRGEKFNVRYTQVFEKDF